jgi:hypothetical protein
MPIATTGGLLPPDYSAQRLEQLAHLARFGRRSQAFRQTFVGALVEYLRLEASLPPPSHLHSIRRA